MRPGSGTGQQVGAGQDVRRLVSTATGGRCQGVQHLPRLVLPGDWLPNTCRERVTVEGALREAMEKWKANRPKCPTRIERALMAIQKAAQNEGHDGLVLRKART